MLYYFKLFLKGEKMLNLETQAYKKTFIKEMDNFCLDHLKKLSDQNLLSQTKLLIQKERNITLQVIQHLSEIESRKLYFKRGFSSLFEYAVKELGYSEGSAYRRIKAMKLCQDLPETASKIRTGNLNLTTVSQLQTFFEKQSRKAQETQTRLQSNQKPLSIQRSDSSPRRIPASSLESKTQKLDVLKKVEGKSRRQTEKVLCEIDPEINQVREKVRYLNKDQVEVKLILDKNSYEKIEQLRNLLAHKNPNMSYGELVTVLTELGLDKYDPRRKLKTQKRVEKESQKIWKDNSSKICLKQYIKNKSQSKTEPQKFYKRKEEKINENLQKQKSRYISAEVRRLVWTRDFGECSYVCSQTKRKCRSKHLLQIDHIRPYSLGGSSDPSSLRLLCAGHNRYRNKLFQKTRR